MTGTLRATLFTIAGMLLVAPAAVAVKPSPSAISLDDPEGVLMASRKIQCSLMDNTPVTYWWRGRMYSRIPGEHDRLLFRVEGMNIRQCVTVTDPAKGTGFKLVSREILLYLDPVTGAVARKWRNPWSGEEVDVLHLANDPVNSTWWPIGRDGRPVTWTGDSQGGRWWQTTTAPLFSTNPLAGVHHEYVGGFYQATEMLNFMGDLDDLLDPRRHTASVRVGWVRISGWLPWMQMSGRAGEVYIHAAGVKLASFDELPEVMKEEIDANYPEYRAPPPGDDPRPSETGRTCFRKQVRPQGAAGH